MFLNSNQLPDFGSSRILVYGDLMLDRYWYGDTSRISPEAPVPVVHVKKSQNRPGGAANVALNIAALGAEVALLGMVGCDAEGQELERILYQNNVECYFLQVQNHPTITKLRVLGQSQQLVRMDFEQPFHQVDIASLIASYQQELSRSNVVILSDYAKGALSQTAPQLISLARAVGVPVLIDPKGNHFDIYQGATLMTPNFKEFEAVVGSCRDEIDIENKARHLIQELALEALLVTRGKDGMTFVARDKPVLHIPTHAQEVFDVTGAGDTVIAVLATTVAAKKSWEDAVYLANVAAGIVVAKLGASTVTTKELHHAVHHEDQSLSKRIMSEEELLEQVAYARAAGETIVMTNGCFDMLHHGHVEYLMRAKALGKRLIVAVNDDASVKRLKGEERPFNYLQDRMALLAALRYVDWVVAFSEDTPAQLIEAVSPDILVKGGDYRPEEIAGGAHVIACGGRVEVLPFKTGYSTTGLVVKIQNLSSHSLECEDSSQDSYERLI